MKTKTRRRREPIVFHRVNPAQCLELARAADSVAAGYGKVTATVIRYSRRFRHGDLRTTWEWLRAGRELLRIARELGVE